MEGRPVRPVNKAKIKPARKKTGTTPHPSRKRPPRAVPSSASADRPIPIHQRKRRKRRKSPQASQRLPPPRLRPFCVSCAFRVERFRRLIASAPRTGGDRRPGRRLWRNPGRCA
jgi:hypothetical protein